MKIIFPIVLLLCAGIWFVDGSANIDGNTTIVGTLGVIASTTLGLLIVGFVLKDYFQFLWYNDCKNLVCRIIVFLFGLIIFPLSIISWVLHSVLEGSNSEHKRRLRNAQRRKKIK